MSIEALAAGAVIKEIAVPTAVEATKQLAEKIAQQSVENRTMAEVQSLEQTQNLNHLNHLESLRLGERTDDYENTKIHEAKAEEELKEKISNEINDFKSAQMESNEVYPDTNEGKNFFYDDNGVKYKNDNGELLPNIKYEINGNKYDTDMKGRITSWEAKPKDVLQGRDETAQIESGGKDRHPDDDGGHLVANINGGSSGTENLIPMRDTINRGDYRKGEMLENQWLKEGKEVYENGRLEYNDDSMRPCKLEKVFGNGETEIKAQYDNVEASIDLLNDVKDVISKSEYKSLRNEIDDMKADGNQVSITSLEKKYENGEMTEVTVGIRNETIGEKTYKRFIPNT